MTPFIVAVVFGSSPESELHINAVIAPTSEAAAALLALEVRQHTGTEKSLTAVAVMELDRPFLETALRATQGELPETGTAQVVSLVPPRGGDVA